MQILRKHKLPFPYRYIYTLTFIFCLIVIIQYCVTRFTNSAPIQSYYIVLFVSNYLTWIILIDWVYGLSKRFNNITPLKISSGSLAFLNIFLLIIIHITISNVFNFLYQNFILDVDSQRWFLRFKNAMYAIFLSRLVDLSIIIIIFKLIEGYIISQNRKLQVIELENQLHISQLESLRAQLDPHFLFNSLHALNTLIGHNDKKAKSMVIKISNLLRKILDRREALMITLEEEMTYLKDYLDIEHERFHDRLSIEFNIQEETKSKMIPSFILQPLAENAFKHGISLLEGKGKISFSSKIKENLLILRMINSIPEKERKVKSTKLGINNLKKRLLQIYGNNQDLNIEKTLSEFIITIIIKTK